ncbi:gentisate 1,2-dioxygenase [Paraburkholderia sediminicola]|uniref:gentisate 1,2-dioxygenase n=1 Tax=Paraburkholderia sediminicola TaxID=458836 RepID=UPI000EB098EE
MELAHEDKTGRQAFYEKLDGVHTAPLWAVMSQLVTPEPRSRCVPHKWDYAGMRALLMEAGGLITAKEAERRVLVLENPGIRGLSQVTQSLYAGLQLILPGEVAPSHRHAAAALRLIIEGSGYTAVNGERIPMAPGDFILTPSWMFHDHGNLSDDPVVWLDGLDVPIVNLFDASFAEGYPGGDVQHVDRLAGDARARYGANMVPLEYEPDSKSSPVFHYPYARVREALLQIESAGMCDASHGFKLQYANPVTGGYPMPTMAAYMQLLPAGFCGQPYRSTDATVYCAREGKGTTFVGNERIEWSVGDVFVVPSWATTSHQVGERSVLFSFSDRAAQKALGVWREERLND